jgi:hypothetical protein
MEPILDPEDRELEEGLLRAGRDVGMSPQLRDKTFAALAAGTVGVTAVSGAKAASTFSWLTTKAGALWTAGAVVGVSGAVALGAGVGTTSPEGLDEPRAPVVAKADGATDPLRAAEQGPDSSATELLEGAKMPHPESVASEPSADLPTKSRNISAPTDSPATDSVLTDSPATDKASNLREELSHVAKVESALNSGNPAKALQLLTEYRGRFPRPQLGLEAEILTIQALHESGSVTAAQGRATRFVERHPNSPLSARAKRYIK